MWLVRLALRRPYTVATLCLVIALMGVLSVRSMAVDVLPAIDIPVVIVVWNYPGMPAEDMERRVTFVSERGLSTSVSGISRIESQTINGISVLRVYFEPGADIGGAIAQITSASLSASRVMPPGIQPPVVLRYNVSNVPVAQLTVQGENLTEQQLFDYGLNFLRLRLFTIPGLSTPAPYGGKQRQIMVDVEPSRAAAKGVAPQDVVDAVLRQNVVLPAGDARLGGTDYDVLVNGSPDTAAAFNRLPVKIVGGAPVYLGDVAHVYDGYALQQNIVRVNGRRSTYLAILKKENASTLAVVDATRDLLPQIQATAPQGTELRLDFDQSGFVRGAIKGVLREALIAGFLVAVMTLGFVGSWRSTVVVCVSIPVAIFIGLVGLKITGQTLNLMTLGGLALAIGMLVDDATVEIENINRNRQQGKGLVRAILDGAQQVAVPALAATLTICIVFLPVVLLTGPAKYLFVALAIAVVSSMLGSYLLSRTLVPALSHLLLAREKEGEPSRHAFIHRLDQWRLRQFDRLLEGYGKLLSLLVIRPKGILALGALVVGASLFLLGPVGMDFFPQVDAGILRLHVRAPSGTRIEETERIVDRVERRVADIVPPGELGAIDDNIGVPLFYNLGFVQSDNVSGADAEILVALADGHRPSLEYARRIRAAINDEMPGVALYFQSADVVGRVLNFGLSAPIDVQIEGSDVAKTLPIARKLERALELIPGTEDVRIAQVLDHPALRVNVDRDRAAQLGLSERDVAQSLLTTLSSSSLTSPNFWINPTNNVNYFVTVQTPIDRMSSVSDLMSIPMTTPAGGAGAMLQPSGALPTAPQPPPTDPSIISPILGSVATLSPAVDRALIRHETVQPILDVESAVEGRDLGAVARDVNRAIADLGPLPSGVRVRLRGQSQTMFTAFGNLALGMVVAIALVYCLLVVLYQSWVDPLLIMIAIPGAFSGILWMLLLTKTTLNVESFMGSIMAIGIAASNSILLVNFANEARQDDDKMEPAEAALISGRTRLRPVLMTALAMILGMLPMALGLGEGGEQNAPLGRAVIGGLLAATVFTLFVVPCAYAALRKQPPVKHMLDRKIEEEYEKGAPEHAEANA
jgi:multidrug efflux pump subunit AcrB